MKRAFCGVFEPKMEQILSTFRVFFFHFFVMLFLGLFLRYMYCYGSLKHKKLIVTSAIFSSFLIIPHFFDFLKCCWPKKTVLGLEDDLLDIFQ